MGLNEEETKNLIAERKVFSVPTRDETCCSLTISDSVSGFTYPQGIETIFFPAIVRVIGFLAYHKGLNYVFAGIRAPGGPVFSTYKGLKRCRGERSRRNTGLLAYPQGIET